MENDFFNFIQKCCKNKLTRKVAPSFYKHGPRLHTLFKVSGEGASSILEVFQQECVSFFSSNHLQNRSYCSVLHKVTMTLTLIYCKYFFASSLIFSRWPDPKLLYIAEMFENR